VTSIFPLGQREDCSWLLTSKGEVIVDIALVKLEQGEFPVLAPHGVGIHQVTEPLENIGVAAAAA